jgi:transglutaminase-like putative cysteine protease
VPLSSWIFATRAMPWRGSLRLSSDQLMTHGSELRLRLLDWRQPLRENSYRTAISRSLRRVLKFSLHLSEITAARRVYASSIKKRPRRRVLALGSLNVLKRQELETKGSPPFAHKRASLG